MGVEIERKFLLAGDAWRGLGRPVLLRQGYLSADPARGLQPLSGRAPAALQPLCGRSMAVRWPLTDCAAPVGTYVPAGQSSKSVT